MLEIVKVREMVVVIVKNLVLWVLMVMMEVWGRMWLVREVVIVVVGLRIVS